MKEKAVGRFVLAWGNEIKRWNPHVGKHLEDS